MDLESKSKWVQPYVTLKKGIKADKTVQETRALRKDKVDLMGLPITILRLLKSNYCSIV